MTTKSKPSARTTTKCSLKIRNEIRKEAMKKINELLWKEKQKSKNNKLSHGYVKHIVDAGMYDGSISLNAVRCSFKQYCRSKTLLSTSSTVGNNNIVAPTVLTSPSQEGNTNSQ